LKKLNIQHILYAKGVYLCMLTVYALLREVLAIQGIVGNASVTYGFFVIGVVLAATLFFFERESFLRRSQWLSMAFLAICVVSTFINRSFDFVSNVKAIAWMTLYFTLLMPYSRSIETESRIHKWVILTTIITTAVLACACLLMYFFDIDYTYVKDGGFANNQGFSHQYMRLWGVYNDANTAAVYSLVAMCFTVYLFIRTNKLAIRILLGIVGVLLFQVVVLSSSRTALVAFVAAFVWIGLYVAYNHICGSVVKRIITAVLVAAIACGTALGVYEAAKFVVPYEKLMIQSITSPSICTAIHKTYDAFYQSSDLNITQGYLMEYDIQPSDPLLEEAEDVTSDLDSEDADDKIRIPESLDRSDEKEDMSNGRFQKWIEVLEVFLEKPILGASPRGISSAAKQINPEGSVAKFGMAAHNSLLEVLAGTGVLGTVVAVGILVWLLVIILRKLLTCSMDYDFLVYSTVLLVMVCEMMFISDVFFTLTFGGVAFWTAAGHIFAEIRITDGRSKQ